MFEKIIIYIYIQNLAINLRYPDLRYINLHEYAYIHIVSSTILQYGVPSSILYVPSLDDVMVEISPTPPSPNECDKVSRLNMSCSFTTTTDTIYTVVVYVNNSFGLSPNDTMTFFCKF